MKIIIINIFVAWWLTMQRWIRAIRFVPILHKYELTFISKNVEWHT